MADVSDILDELRSLIDPRNIERAGLTVFAEHTARIFEQGQAADGGGIGSYSTEPTYISPKNSPRNFPTRGKSGKTKFSDGTPHKTGYFAGGYKEFRGKIGRENARVNLDLFGDMRKSYIAGFHGNKYAYGFAFAGEDEKASGNEKRFGKDAFALTNAEADLFLRTLVGD